MKFLIIISIIFSLSSCLNEAENNKIVKDKMEAYIPNASSAKYILVDTSANNILTTWADEVLFDVKEPLLNTYSGNGEFVRLVWLRSFETPIVIRLNRFNDTVYTNIKELRLKVNQTEPAKVIIDTMITLDKNRWYLFTKAIETGNFWKSSYSDSTVNKDGAAWFLECRINNQYKVIQRWDDGHLSSRDLHEYLSAVIDFANQYVHLESAR